ncbi:monooxygenase [Dactylosporangium sp. CA-092794]|uniref:monooxygenase n=1 Tax=Dactylosporangium sp. CA-092794 TaxID=3239929 RepID=UPI003D8EC701
MIARLYVWRVPHRAVPAMFWSMAVDRRKIRKKADFAKLLGTGNGSEFGVGAADLTRWAAIVVGETAVRPPMRGACGSCTITLEPIASRGAWSGKSPFSPEKLKNPAWERTGAAAGKARRPATGRNGGPASGAGGARGELAAACGEIAAAHGETTHAAGGATTAAHGEMAEAVGGAEPIAVLTRARLKATQAWAFWRAIDPVGRSLAGAEGLYCAFGIGEAPVGFQGTVSVWRSAADIVRFAYRQPEHAAVVERTARQGWYAEELFARFRVLDIDGDREVIGWRDGQ